MKNQLKTVVSGVNAITATNMFYKEGKIEL